MNELMHYGVKGQKWGIRRFQNPDGSLTSIGKNRNKLKKYSHDDLSKELLSKKKKSPYGLDADDYILKKDNRFARFTIGDEQNLGARTYVSKQPRIYAQDYIYDDPGNTYIDVYKTNQQILIAGEKTVNKILNNIGEKPLKSYDFYDKPGTDRDFMLKESKMRSDFIKEARKNGYGGIIDTSDGANGMNIAPSATILFANEAIDRIGHFKLSDFYRDE